MFLIYVKSVINSIGRRCYWIYNAIHIKAGKGSQVSFTVRVEGKGKIILEQQVRIERNVLLVCADKSILLFGGASRLNEGVSIHVMPGVAFFTGKNFSLGSYSLCHANADWSIANNVTIAMHCHILSREKGLNGRLQIGENSYIGDFTIIDVSGDITIGKNIAIGPHCTIYTHDHNYKDEQVTIPWKGKPVIKNVIIEDGAWIGANVTILPGVTIGEKAIVAACSVITKSIPPNTVNAGLPARVIKTNI